MRPNTALALLLVTPLLLTGCLDDAGSTEPAGSLPTVATDADGTNGTVVWIPDGAWDPGAGAPWYVPEVLEVTAPATIVFVNNDTVEHVTVASALPLRQDGGNGHDHGAHDHGAGASSAFEVTTGPRESRAVDLTEPGRFAVHCHPHPWMTMEIIARLATPATYEIVWTEEVVRFEFSGELGEGDEVVHPFDLPDGPVARVTATLTWDDSEDDVRDPNGAALVQSEPDTLSLSLNTLDGAHGATGSDTARQGNLQVTVPETDSRAERVAAREPHEAWERAGGNAPAEPWLAGTFEATVALDATGHAGAPAGPLEDTRSSYKLSVEIVLATPHPVGPGAEPPGEAPGVEHADHGGHAHEH